MKDEEHVYLVGYEVPSNWRLDAKEYDEAREFARQTANDLVGNERRKCLELVEYAGLTEDEARELVSCDPKRFDDMSTIDTLCYYLDLGTITKLKLKSAEKSIQETWNKGTLLKGFHNAKINEYGAIIKKATGKGPEKIKKDPSWSEEETRSAYVSEEQQKFDKHEADIISSTIMRKYDELIFYTRTSHKDKMAFLKKYDQLIEKVPTTTTLSAMLGLKGKQKDAFVAEWDEATKKLYPKEKPESQNDRAYEPLWKGRCAVVEKAQAKVKASAPKF